MEGEEPTLFQVLRILRREAREIQQVTNTRGNTHTALSEITVAFVTHLSSKYQPIAVDEKSIETMQNYLTPGCPATYAEQLEQPITEAELLAAVRAGARRISPEIDGMSLEFYSANWETIREDLLRLLNHMFLHKHIPQRQKQGILVCLPKSNTATTLDDYRPISLLTTEYKLLARIVARRLRQALAEQLQKSQFCGVPGNSILDATSSVRDVLAHYEATGTPLCVLTLDFKQAFDRVSHHYLFCILRGYGISPFLWRGYRHYTDRQRRPYK